jgi:hypothetical protein
MKLRDGLVPQRYEQKLQENRYERQAELKRVERLSVLLAKKVASARTKVGPAKVPMSFAS